MSNSDNEQDNIAKILAKVNAAAENVIERPESISIQRDESSSAGPIFTDIADISLSEQLAEKEYHPVLIYGTRASGKTTLLTSLFSYVNFEMSSPGTCRFGDEIIPQNSEYGARVLREARDIFHNDVPNFHRGITAKSTRLETPIFIPIEFVPRTKGNAIKIAFLESQGEFYHVDSSNRKGEIQLKKEVMDIYKYYPEGLSIVLVAPFSLSSRYEDGNVSAAESDEIASSDQSLYASLVKYNELRANEYRHLDKFLFILTKWDEFTGGPDFENFINPPEALVCEQIAEKFEMSWAYFQKMPQYGGRNSMPYCAGIISGSDRLPTPPAHREALATFPRILWNWLYENAQQNMNDPSGPGSQNIAKSIFRKLFG